MYLLLAGLVALALLTDVVPQPPMVVPNEVRGVYNAVEQFRKVAPNGERKIAIISIVWASGTIAENRPQTEAVTRHLFRRDIPFLMLPWDQQGTTLAYDAVKRIADEMGKEYGRDWVALGFQPPYIGQVVQGMAVDIQGTFRKDRFGTPLAKIPMMEGIKTASNIGLVVEVTPSATVGEWIAFLGQPYKVPIAYAPTAVMVPEGHNFLDAHQIVGMLPGLIGAAEYEQLLDYKGFAVRAATALSASHVLIIILIILGNLGYFVSRRQRSRG